jgi:uncharacterized RDD family membrane protein YckC
MSSEALTNEEILVIETPERVPLEFALASIGNRFLACAVDHTIQILTMIAVVIIGSLTGRFDVFRGGWSGAPRWVQAVVIILVFLLWFGYFALFEWRWRGQTPGKRLLKLRAIREDGRPLTFWEAAARNLLRTFDMFPPPFYSVGLVSVFVSSTDQRIGDLFAGTIVVRERAEQAPTFEEVFNAPVSDPALRRAFKPVPFEGDVKLLNEREIEVVETFLRRRWDLNDRTREWMAWRVATPILYKIRPSFDPATFTYEGFLEELLHRYFAARRFNN